MFKYFLLTFITLIASGCNNLTIKNFDRSPHSFVTNNKVGVVVRDGVNDWSSSPIVEKYLNATPEFNDAVTSACGTSKVKMDPALIPIATSLGKFIFDIQIDRNTKEIQKLKQAAQSSYVSRVIVPNDIFIKSTCVVIYRYDQNDESIGFVSVLKLERKGDGFVFVPTYIKANNTVAITKQAETGNAAKVNASIAVSLKAIMTEGKGPPQLIAIGEGVTTVVDVNVGPNEKASCVDGCDGSDMVPYISDRNKFISVTFSVTETGKIGINLDEKLAEVKALKEAIGPALKESLREYLEEDQ